MPKPMVIVAPAFRAMDEIFDPPTLDRLRALADVEWGRDGPMPLPEFHARVAEAAAVVFGTWHYGVAALDGAGPQLRAVLEVAGGHSHADLPYGLLFDRGILVGSAAPAFGPVVAEHALALTLAVRRNVADSDRGFRSGTERYLHAGNEGASSLYGVTVGFVGCGGLARSLLPLLRPFGVDVLGYDPWLPADELADLGITPAPLDEVFTRASVVYVLAVPTPANRGLIDGRLLGMLGPSDTLVLASRAHVVDFETMTDLLLAGRFRAGIDVYPDEPLAAGHPIRGAAGAVLSAHLAGALPDALLEIGRMVVDDLEAILSGRPPTRMQYATPDLLRGLRS